MLTWVVRDLEPLPIDRGTPRVMRSGMLSRALAQAGHEVEWFTSTFDHYRHEQRPITGWHDAGPGLRIDVLPGLGYRRHLGARRIRHNRRFARDWSREAARAPRRPDVVVTANPTTETAHAVAAYGRAAGVPTVLSIDDLWPDFFLDYVPAAARGAARPLVHPLDRQIRFAAAAATSLVAVSEEYLQWGLRKAGRERGPLDRVVPLGYAPLPAPGPAEVAALRERLGLGERRVVSFVGSWGMTYDLDAVLEAARALAHRDDVVFAVAGDPGDRPAVAEQLRALPNVVLTGWIDAPQIAGLLTTSEIGLLPYDAAAPQGLPNKVYEYLAYGCYQLATLSGEVQGFYAGTLGGRAVTRASLGAQVAASLDDPEAVGAAAREARIAAFATYDADLVYAGFAQHVARVAEAGGRGTDGDPGAPR